MDLFGNQIVKEISIADAAKQLSVSIATIKNWIKVGNIVKTRRGYLDHAKFDVFIKSEHGTSKLTARANKSGKDSHNHDLLSNRVLSKVKDKEENLDELGSFYERSLSDSYRNKEGIYYTPKDVITREFANISKVSNKVSFCDPSCGSGNYIMAAIEHGFNPELIFGYDIDPIAVEVTKERIFRKTGYTTANIVCVDFLKDSMSSSKTFDFIFTNPPWGKKLAKADKEAYRKRYNSGSSVDTCSLFLFASIERLNSNGVISFLLPESFFNVASFESARISLLKLKLTHLSNYGKSFDGLLTRAQSFTATKIVEADDEAEEPVSIFSERKHYFRKQSTFLKNPKTIINLYTSGEEAKVIDKVYKNGYKILENSAKWGIGIVTGDNKKLIKNSAFDGSIAIYRGSDIRRGSISKPTNFISDDFSLYQQVAPLEIYQSVPKIVYKFISKRICFYVDYDAKYFLNSANMFVLNDCFPIKENQLADLFNSDIMNWIYAKIFNSRKILRKDLEKLPIHIDYFKQYENFDESSYLNYLGIIEKSDGVYRTKR